MSIIDKAVEANRNYAKSYEPTLGKRPAPKIAVVTCMDPRLSGLPGILGLPQADLDVIRIGGPAVTEDVLGSLLFPTVYSEPQRYFFSFSASSVNVVNTRLQIKKVGSHPWIAKDAPVRGPIFDVDIGRLREVKLVEHERAA